VQRLQDQIRQLEAEKQVSPRVASGLLAVTVLADISISTLQDVRGLRGTWWQQAALPAGGSSDAAFVLLISCARAWNSNMQ